MIEIREDSFYHHLWFVGAKGVDWLALLFKHKGETWTCVYRFRYHEDDKAFDSNDRKSWYEIRSSSTEETPPESFVKAISHIAGMTADHFQGEIHSVPIRGDGKAAFEALKRQSWTHVRTEPHEQPTP